MGAGKQSNSNIVISYLANKNLVELTPGLCYYLDEAGMAIYHNGIYIGHVKSKIGKDVSFYCDDNANQFFDSAIKALHELLRAKDMTIPYETL